ncbi:leucine-rich repeat-containing protein 74A-like [Watersipora subatra]|uniref:leucine-rich repeat-containing protein 74A-like n=1 Tax=Watersipora subatra TaxID=2589382 RepID=UPI00355AE896
MATRAYIGTARDVHFDDKVTEHHISDLNGKEREEYLTPIVRDPIMEMKYKEAIKGFPNRRGKVDNTKVIARKNRTSSATQRTEHTDSYTGVSSSGFRNRLDTFTDMEEEKKEETISQATYLSTCKHLNVEPTPIILKSLNEDSLIIKYHPVGNLSLKAACVALVANTMVATVDLTHADIGTTGAVYLGDVLRENLYILDLIIAENNVGSEGIKCICEALQENRALKYLNVSGNKLTEVDAGAIRDMLLENTTLKGLNASHNEFTDIGGVLLAEGIEGNDSILDIDLSWNHLRQKGARRIIESLMVNTTIARADLSFNGFHDAAVGIGELMAVTTTLTYLDLTSNRITDVDMAHFLKGFERNETLETLLIGKNPYTAPFCKQLLQIVCNNPKNKIKELDLDSQSVEIEFLDLIHTTRKERQLYINHGTVLKADLQKEATDDFSSSDPMMVLMECIAQRQLKLVDIFQSLDRDDSKTITRTELREGLQSLNIPMSGRAIDKLMKKLDVDDNGEVDFAEFMEAQREYLKKKQEKEEAGAAGVQQDETKMKEKVAKLIKMRRLAKMAKVLDSSTEKTKKKLSIDAFKMSSRRSNMNESS